MAYSFNNFTLPLVDAAPAPLASRIPTADTPARPGAYQGRRQAAARTISVTGTLQAASFADLQTAWSDFQSAHDVDGPKALVLRDGWFYHALPDAVSESDVQPASLHYQADYKLGDPFSYSLTMNTDTLTVGGTKTITAGGNKAALPTITLVVTAAPAGGTVIIANTTTGQTATIRPSAAQTYRFNCRTEKMELGSMGVFAGQFLSLAVGANAISVSTTGGCVVSSASIAWRNRSL